MVSEAGILAPVRRTFAELWIRESRSSIFIVSGEPAAFSESEAIALDDRPRYRHGRRAAGGMPFLKGVCFLPLNRAALL